MKRKNLIIDPDTTLSINQEESLELPDSAKKEQHYYYITFLKFFSHPITQNYTKIIETRNKIVVQITNNEKDLCYQPELNTQHDPLCPEKFDNHFHLIKKAINEAKGNSDWYEECETFCIMAYCPEKKGATDNSKEEYDNLEKNDVTDNSKEEYDNLEKNDVTDNSKEEYDNLEKKGVTDNSKEQYDNLVGFSKSPISKKNYVIPTALMLASFASFTVANAAKISSAYLGWFAASAFGFSVSGVSIVCPIVGITLGLLAIALCLAIRQKRATGSFLPGIFSSCFKERKNEIPEIRLETAP